MYFDCPCYESHNNFGNLGQNNKQLLKILSTLHSFHELFLTCITVERTLKRWRKINLRITNLKCLSDMER